MPFILFILAKFFSVFIAASDTYDAASQEVSSNGPFRSLQLNNSCTNCENIFKAVLFLHNRIPEKAHLQDEAYQFGFTKDSASFKELAAELGSIEPSLRGVTPLALVSLYERIIKERKALSDFLVMATGFTWTDTRMSDMAQSLVETDRELRDRENRQQAAKSEVKKQQVTEAQAVEQQVMDAMLGTLTGNKRASQVIDEADEDAGVRITNDTDEDADDDADDGSDSRPPPVVPSESTPTPIHRISDARPGPSRRTGEPSIMQPDILRQRESFQLRALSRPPMQVQHHSSASESTDMDPLSPVQAQGLSGFARPTPRFKRHATAAETDRISALLARVEKLEEQNRQLRMDMIQVRQSTQNSVNNIDDDLRAFKRRNVQSSQSVQEQLTLVQTRVTLVQGQFNQIDLDVLDTRKKTRDLDNRITTLENTNRLNMPFT
ncbi:hypothetical protein F5H01DRAFT_359475 [Linnemannia elongata]|nr:hypothetical protein F5H01DRAFT_359475 [Linnemannia elongata]